MDNTEKPPLIIDMVSDPVCPWCFIGKRALDRALMALSFSHDLIVRYRPYQLSPETPSGGVDRAAHLEKKFPDAAHRDQMSAALTDAAQKAGVDFDPAAPAILPNTLDAHRVIRWAYESVLQREVAEAIFAGYWQQGADIGDGETLARLAGSAGMDADDVRARLASDEDKADVREEIDGFRAGGVTGVPTFIVNEQAGFAGALPPDQLLETLRQIAGETTPPLD